MECHQGDVRDFLLAERNSVRHRCVAPQHVRCRCTVSSVCSSRHRLLLGHAESPKSLLAFKPLQDTLGGLRGPCAPPSNVAVTSAIAAPNAKWRYHLAVSQNSRQAVMHVLQGGDDGVGGEVTGGCATHLAPVTMKIDTETIARRIRKHRQKPRRRAKASGSSLAVERPGHRPHDDAAPTSCGRVMDVVGATPPNAEVKNRSSIWNRSRPSGSCASNPK